MILNTMHLNQRLSVDDQIKEIERIRNAPVGTVLFTSSIYENTDVIDTLIHRSGIRFTEGVDSYIVHFYKAE